jgi:RNA polymerase-interacting CarD/CdnL/TRCF family regulator
VYTIQDRRVLRASPLAGLAFFLIYTQLRQTGGAMNFHVGDPVVHWTYGLGEIIGLEERVLSGQKTLYYAVKVHDLTVWVPADDNLENRLRPPTTPAGFKQLFAILTSPGEPLPDDRQERKIKLVGQLKDGRAESLCQVIRDLSAYQHVRALNDNDQHLMKRTREALIGEWGFALSILPAQAESELHRLLTSGTAGD